MSRGCKCAPRRNLRRCTDLFGSGTRARASDENASFLVGVRALVHTVDRSGATIINPCAKLGVESRELAAQASLSPACQRPPGPWATGSGSFRGLWGFSTYFLTVMQIRNISVSVRFPTHAGPKSLISDRARDEHRMSQSTCWWLLGSMAVTHRIRPVSRQDWTRCLCPLYRESSLGGQAQNRALSQNQTSTALAGPGETLGAADELPW